MDFVPHTPEDERYLLEAIGYGSIEALFADIPVHLMVRDGLDLPAPLSEQDLWRDLRAVSRTNAASPVILMGAGAYRHYIPAVVQHVISRSEFYTAYTPYQAEISQGILQAIYEYQTMIARLTGMQAVNASMYDGATAVAEAAVLAAKTLQRSGILVLRSVHPEYRQVLRTYAWASGCEVREAPYGPSGQLDPEALGSALDEEIAAVVVQSPNFFGVIEDIAAVAPIVHDSGALLVAGFTEATSLGILKPAGQAGADFVAGEGQAFGNPLNYGGPYLGIFASTDKFLRKIPGRIVGATVDREGRRGFVLTLQAREQHIRREKATSNICSNEALCALAGAVYLVSLGKNLRRLAELNVRKARYLKDRLTALKGWEPLFTAPFYNEFALRCPDPREVNEKLHRLGIVGGYELGSEYPDLEKGILLCATEMLSREDMDAVVSALE